MAKVWVDGSEYDAYKQANPDADIVRCEDGIQGNIGRVRNHILEREFARGMDVVLIIDDDLEGIYHYEKKGNNAYEKIRVETEDFEDWVEKNSILAVDIGAKVWGVNNLMDKLYYTHNEPFATRKFVGGFYAFLKGNECWFDDKTNLKEDVDMFAQQLNRYRVVWRLNNHYGLFKQWTNAGGQQTLRSIDRELEACHILRQKWGSDLVKCPRKRDVKKVSDINNSVFKSPIKGV
jgi:hypothetical protein